MCYEGMFSEMLQQQLGGVKSGKVNTKEKAVKSIMQNNLLIGNGVNIQFNKTDYTTQQIALRILKNFDRDDFPSHIIVDFPYLMKNYIGLLFLESRKIVAGEYDKFAISSAEKGSLTAFKKQYSAQINSLRITDIGFEDYYLIHDLVCHKTGTQNPDQFYAREGMKVAYLYSIFNDGKLNQLYRDYPPAFTDYLIQFDRIFTTNYDSNIESAIGKNIFHIHGQFDKKAKCTLQILFEINYLILLFETS